MRELEVAAALIRKGREFIICQRKEKDKFALLWEFPGGKCRKSESFKECIKREIKEELGIKIRVEELLGIFEDQDKNLKIRAYLFLSSIKEGIPLCFDCKNFSWVSLSETRKYNFAPLDKKILLFLERNSWIFNNNKKG